MSDKLKMVQCDGCGKTLREMHAAITKTRGDGEPLPRKMALCGDCMRANEQPPRISLATSSWAPWGEMRVYKRAELDLRSDLMRSAAVRAAQYERKDLR